ncbi:MAG TPA: BON domain-containing protein [Pirellulales bacterium]|jgi:hypothetical protein|nr:BON domain-containing protein [Pirellulales bacterium]
MTLNLLLTDNTGHFDSPENLALKRRIVNHLQRRFPNLDTIDVEAHRGTVILRGTVSSTSNRWRCVDSCQHVRGVLNVIDRLILSYCLPNVSKMPTRRVADGPHDPQPPFGPEGRRDPAAIEPPRSSGRKKANGALPLQPAATISL